MMGWNKTRRPPAQRLRNGVFKDHWSVFKSYQQRARPAGVRRKTFHQTVLNVTLPMGTSDDADAEAGKLWWRQRLQLHYNNTSKWSSGPSVGRWIQVRPVSLDGLGSDTSGVLHHLMMMMMMLPHISVFVSQQRWTLTATVLFLHLPLERPPGPQVKIPLTFRRWTGFPPNIYSAFFKAV